MSAKSGFNVLNSSKEEVIKTTERNLWHHANLFQDINYPLGKMILHIGGKEGGKLAATERFFKNFNNLPKEITQLLTFENDDKSFTTREVLNICQEINAPMVLDVHHHNCNSGGDELEPMLKDIFATWEGQPLPPKLHFSSPKAGEKDKKHADYIDAASFIEFIEKCIPLGIDLDIMLEAKQADLALYKLADIFSLSPLDPIAKYQSALGILKLSGPTTATLRFKSTFGRIISASFSSSFSFVK